MAKSFENGYFDSAAVSSFIYSERIIKRIGDEISFDGLLYGSDYPVVLGSDMVYEVSVIKGCRHLTGEEKEKILGLNAIRILNL